MAAKYHLDDDGDDDDHSHDDDDDDKDDNGEEADDDCFKLKLSTFAEHWREQAGQDSTPGITCDIDICYR